MNLESVTWSKIEARASLGGPGEAWWVGVVGGAQPTPLTYGHHSPLIMDSWAVDDNF